MRALLAIWMLIGSLYAAPALAQVDLAVTTSDNPDPVQINQNVDYDINLSNLATGATASGITVTIFASASLTYVPTATAGWNCVLSGTVNCTPVSPNLAGGQSAPVLRVRFQAPPTAQTVQISVTADSVQSDTDPTNNTNIVQTTTVVQPNADLSLAITPSTPSATAGTPIKFTANVSNAGPGNAPGLMLTGTLSGAATFSSFTASSAWSCSFNSGAITCTYQAGSPVGTLANGVSAAPIDINLIAGPGSGNATVNLTASSQANDPTGATANSSIVVTGVPPASVDMQINKSVVGAQPVPRGVPFIFRLQVGNSSGSNQSATAIQVNDPLPAGLTLQSASGAGWICSGNVQCSYTPTLSPGQSAAPLDLNVVYDQPVPAGGTSLSNTASVSAAESDPQPANNTSSASVNVRSSADVGAQLIGPSSVIAGTSFTVDLIASNAGPDDATNVSVSGTIASGFTVGAVNGGNGWSCLASSQTVSCTRATFAVGSSTAASLTLTAPSAAGGPFNNTATISASNFDPVSGNNSTAYLVTVTAAIATRGLTKTDSADPVAVNTSYDYTLTVSNTGNVVQSGVTVVDTLPTALHYESFSGNGWTCNGATTAGATITCTLSGQLAVGASNAVRLRVRGDSVGTATNQAQATSIQNSAPTTVSETTQIVDTATLSFAKRARTSPIAFGGNAFFDLTIDNPSQTDFSGLVVIDDLPTGLTPVTATGTGWTCSIAGARVDCRRPQLTRLTSTTIAIEARPANVGTYVNRAALTWLGSSAALNASDSVVVFDARGTADLAIDKSDSVDPATTGTDFDYRLRVSNLGPDLATDVRVTDVLPNSMQFVSATGPGWDCVGPVTVVCRLQNGLPAGLQSTVTVRVRAPAAGTISNTASVTAVEIDTVPGNNSDSESTVVQGEIIVPPPVFADLRVVASGPQSVAPGGAVQLLANVVNTGPSTATFVIVRATAVGPWTLTSGSGGPFVCVAVASGVECRVDSLAANRAEDLVFIGQANANASTPLTAQLAVASAVQDPALVDNAAEVVVAIDTTPPPPPPGTADLSITKTDSADPVGFTERFTYTLTARNLGPASANAVVIRDTLPAGLTFVSAAGAGMACTGGANVVCTAATALSAGAQLSVLVTVDAGSEPVSITNTASVGSSTTDPVVGNNSAQQTTQISAPDGTDAEELLEGSIGGGDTLANDAVNPVVDLCDGATGNIASLCTSLFSDAAQGNDAAVASTLRALYPEEVLSQFASLNQLAATQFFNLDARMSELRGGTGGFSMAGLNATLGTQSVPLGLLSSLFQNDDEPQVGGPGDLISPWGFFVNGNISRGDQSIDPNDREVVVDFDSIGVTAGVDYRKSARWILGGALGYNRFSSNLTDLGELETSGFTLTGYNSYSLNDQVYWDSRVSYGRITLDQTRRLRIRLSDFSLDESIDSSTDASQLTFASTLGYAWNRGAWTITPSGFLRYVRSDVDGFAESGSDFAIRYGDQQVTSLVFGAGVQISRVFSLANGVLVPQFDFIWNQETGNDDTVIQAGFVNGNGEFFLLTPETPDRSYGDIGFGLVYIMANGRQAYLQWRQSIGIDGLDRSTINLGARFEF